MSDPMFQSLYNLTTIFICSRFRLASLQINELQDCHTQYDLEVQLESLPHDLYEVYDRIVSGLDERNLEYVLKILQWLSFSARPLQLTEIAQVTGVVPDVAHGLRFESSRAFTDPRSVLTVCSSFVTEINGECSK
jgi:hypothetical protein